MVAAFFASASTTEAAATGTSLPVLKQYSATGTAVSNFQAYANAMKNGVRVAVGDTDGDGQPEIVTAPGQGGGPEIRVYSLAGQLKSRFFAYAKTFRGGVNVSVYDLNGDGRAEIITGPGMGGGPDVKIFAHNGNLINRFFAFDKNFRGGVSIAAGAFGRNGEPLIAVASGYGSGHIRVFNPSGIFTGISFFPFGSVTHGLSIGALPINGQRWQLLVAPERNAPPTVKVFNLSATNVPVKSFSAFATSFRGGLRLAGADLDGDGVGEIIAGAGGGGGPQVRIFTAEGSSIRSFFAYSTSFRGGINVAAYGGLIYTGPSAIGLDGRADLPKYIEVDLSDQTLKLFVNGRLISTRKVSTGKWTTPTPVGTFAIKNKITMAYSKPYDLYMEWWMAFTPDGSYGLHALPFWKQANGGRLYEGLNHLGSPASHGCIRQSLTEATSLFRWADIGTTVIVKK